MWAKQNPYPSESVAQHPPHIEIWTGVSSKLMTGPYLFDVSVIGEN
jgi:hypothetical protein